LRAEANDGRAGLDGSRTQLRTGQIHFDAAGKPGLCSCSFEISNHP
jgi:hypothetical protein